MRWALLLLALASTCVAAAADPNKVLRVASPDVDTLDPQQATTTPAQRVIQAIYEGLYNWDYLNMPAGLVPVTATAPPEISDGGKTWRINLKRGIHFTDDPAFHGKARELVADDYN
jgi:ABC-type transport system substrate-binding protein